MTARELAAVLLKVLGVYWVVSAVLSVPNVLALRSTPVDAYGGVGNPEAFYTAQLLTTVFVFGIGVTLLCGTPGVLRVLFAEPREAGPPLSSFSLQAVGLSLLGAWLLAYALPGIASSGVVLFALSKGGRELERSEYLRQNWVSMLQPCFEAAVGVWLFFGARGVAAEWHRVRPKNKRRAGG